MKQTEFSKIIKIFLSAVLAVSAVFSLCTGAFAVTNEKNSAEEYLNPYGKTLVCSDKGSHDTAPENSLPAIKEAVRRGADMVKIDIKKTSDGVLVLLADDTVNRTTSGFGSVTNINELTYDELSELKLLEGSGGYSSKVTEEKIPSLEDVLKNREDCIYLLDAPFEYKDDIYSLASKYDMLESVVFLFKDAKPEQLAEWKTSLGENIMSMTYFKGNVIFSALSHLNKSVNNAECIYFATKVPSGVVFGETVTGKAEGKTRLAVDFTDKKLCGNVREDTEVWWDEMISRGYSIIITDYVAECRAYVNDCETKRAELQNVYDKCVKNWSLPDLKADNYLDYKRAYNNAAVMSEKLLNDGSSARSDIVTAIYELQKAYNDINSDYDEIKNGTVGMTVTPVRIMLCIVATVAVVAAEVFVYKKKKKN